MNKTETPEEEMMFLLTLNHGTDISLDLPQRLLIRRVGCVDPEIGSSRQRLIVDGVDKRYLDGLDYIHTYERVLILPHIGLPESRKRGRARVPNSEYTYTWVVHVD